MASSTASPELLTELQNKATQLRIESVRATSEAGSGHPSSCCSAADIVAALFFSVMRYDPTNPKAYNSDRFVLSKGHAAPLLYAAWAEAGLFPKSELLKLRPRENGYVRSNNRCAVHRTRVAPRLPNVVRRGGSWESNRCREEGRVVVPGIIGWGQMEYDEHESVERITERFRRV